MVYITDDPLILKNIVMKDISDINVVDVHLAARSYKIYIGCNLNEQIADFIADYYGDKSLFILCDTSVEELYARPLTEALRAKGVDAPHIYSVPSGEQSKSVHIYADCLSWLAQEGARRDSLIIAVGGGVIGDLAGFVAASYMRGIDFIQVPTTLLAQVDSSVGGKTAINIPEGKNLVGAFYQPKAVFCDSAVLKTLPMRELRAGYAEIYKYGLLWDSAFMAWLEDGHAEALLKHDLHAVHYAVKRCCEIKAEIVSQDEREGGVRALLNLGHTFGHALEALCSYDDRLRHGEAVAIGMCLAARFSAKLGYLSSADVEIIEAHIRRVGLPSQYADIPDAPEITVDDMMKVMAKDKKADAKGINFVVMQALGRTKVTSSYAADDLHNVLHEFLN